MKRKIVGISGQFALADDGSCWMWTDTGWKPWGRGELPESEGLDYYQVTSGPPWPTTQGVPHAGSTIFHADGSVTLTGEPFVDKTATSEHEVAAVPPKRGPGRPRKVQP